MSFPLYVAQDSDGQFVGVSPQSDLTYKGESLEALCADVRKFADLIKPPVTPHDAEAFVESIAGMKGGAWINVDLAPAMPAPVGKREKRTRRNISITTRLEDRIEAAASAASMTFSGWITQAANEKFARGG